MPSEKWPKRCRKLVGAMMVKNEAERLVKTTLVSIRDFCPELVIFDTGSTDNTIEVISTFCKENDMVLHLKQGEFVNFSVSRNVLLDFCDEIYKGKDMFLLMLDAHDELQEGHVLADFVNKFKGSQSGFYLTQRWWCGNTLDSYYNVRMIRTHFKWRYKCPVHEYIVTPLLETESKASQEEFIYRMEGVYLFQDRVADDTKSAKRFKRDKELLYAEYQKDPHEPRTLFYLAQTCSCLGILDEAYKFYLLRSKEAGFCEEVYHAFYRLGEISNRLGHDWEESMTWYLKAFQHSQRAEPLVRIAEYYKDFNMNGENKPEWHTCYMYAQMACQLIFPFNQILFINRRDYTYKRWHLLGISSYYVGRYREGKDACIKALEAENNDIDRGNLKFYLDQELSHLQGEQLNYKCLISLTLDDKEVRSKDDVEVKHNKVEIVGSVVEEMLKEKKAQNKQIPVQVANIFKMNNSFLNLQNPGNPFNGQTFSSPGSVASAMAGTAQEPKLPRKYRREKLRQMLKEKKMAAKK